MIELREVVAIKIPTGSGLPVLLAAFGVAAVVVVAVLASGVLTDSSDTRPSAGRARVTSSPSPTPTYIEIRGQQVALALGMIAKHSEGAFCNPPCPTTSIWQVTYDVSAEDPPDSWIIFDQDFNLLESRIFSGDMELFQPLLDALDPPYDIFASPPAYMFIRDKKVPLAPGMRYGQGEGVGNPGSPLPVVWQITYDSDLNEIGHSWLTFDDQYNILGSHIRSEDQEEFQPILDAFVGP